MKTHPIIGRRYQVVRRLGRGAWGEVFLVDDLLEPGRQLALKTRRLDPHDTGETRASLAQEFRLLTRVRHPNLARIYDLGLTREPTAGLSQIYFTRQYVDGVDIIAALEEASAEASLEAAAVLCHALATVHDHGIVHGDLSAANVLGPVGAPKELKIIDFGLAITLGADNSQISGLRGTLYYVAPEVLRGANLSPRTDLYALGALLHHALTGEPPFKGSPAAVIQQHLDVTPPALNELRPDLPAVLISVVRRLLAKDPAHRYATAWDALRDLEAEAGPMARPLAEAPLLGRDAELANLERLARPGTEARVVGIIGEDSSGRTRILEALRWRIELGGRTEVMELSVANAQPDPLGGIRELAAKVNLLMPNEPEDAVIADMLGGVIPNDPARLWPSFAAVIVETLKNVPSTLLVDDLHLAPEPAFELLKHVVRVLDETPEAPPLMITGRPGDRVEAFLVEVECVERVVLAELDEADTERLVAAVACGENRELAAKIRSHASGLPGYVEEVTRALLERGDEIDVESLPVPTGLEAAVRERVSRLGPRERVLLDIAAVTDELLHWEKLVDVPRGLDHRSFLTIARNLCSSGLLVEHEGERFSFPRTAVRDAVYTSCPLRARRKLHAAQFERMAPAGEPLPTRERLVAAARHAIWSRPRGETVSRAVSVVLAAASFLRDQSAPSIASQILRPTMEFAKGDELRKIRLELADALATTGEYQEAVELLSTVADGSEGAERGEALALAGGVLERKGAYDEARELLERALDCDLPARAKAEALRSLASIHLARADYDDAAKAANDALVDSEADEALLARILAISGTAASYVGDHRTAVDTLERALHNARNSGDTSTEALVAGHLAIVYGRAGRARDSAMAYRDAAALAERSGDLGRLPAHLMNLGVAHHGLGEYSQALGLYRRAARHARRMGKQSVVVASLVNLADLYAHLGAADEGRRTALRALLLARRRGMTSFEARALQALAECAALQSPASGVDDAERAAELFEELGLESHVIEARLVAAELMLWAGEPKKAGEAAQHALAKVQNLGDPALLARARLVLNEARVSRGETAGCREVLKELSAGEGAPELPPDVRWRAFAALGAVLAQQGETARAERCNRAGLEILEATSGRVPPEYRDSLTRHPARRALLRRVQPGPIAQVTEDRVFRLMEVNRSILGERDPRRLLALALDTAVELCGAERGFLITLGVKGAVKVEVARNLDREGVRSARLKVSRSIAEEVAQKGEPLLTVNAREDKRFSHFASVQDLRLRSVMCVPIRGRESTLGTLYLDNRFESARFAEADLKLLLAFSDVVAVALENARLIEENSKKAAELEKAKAQLEAASDQQAKQLQSALRELEATREALGLKYDYSQIIGRSPGMLRVFQILDRIIDTHVPVLIHGESGTGKELIARAIHFNGPRKAAPFISVNCGAIPESLLESELFGHVRGAFTGATADREGLLPAADRGSLFLDEIGDMSLAMQTKLLRALQEGEVRPVGASEDRHVDVRIIAASHRDLAEEVAAGRFREDLYYRVNVVRINLPPLRERPDDIPVLAEHLLERCAGELGGIRKRLTPDAIEALLKFEWPGNVRELENLLKNAAVLSSGAEIRAVDIPLSTTSNRVSEVSDTLNLAELERQAIHRALKASNGNKKKAAELLGIARLTLYRKLKGYEAR